MDSERAPDRMCKQRACHCMAAEDDFCGEFCQGGDHDDQLDGCGCGHVRCDTTNMGFDRNSNLPVSLG
jgi:hypothetical protein